MSRRYTGTYALCYNQRWRALAKVPSVHLEQVQWAGSVMVGHFALAICNRSLQWWFYCPLYLFPLCIHLALP
jgi:hypothetical protein